MSFPAAFVYSSSPKRSLPYATSDSRPSARPQCDRLDRIGPCRILPQLQTLQRRRGQSQQPHVHSFKPSHPGSAPAKAFPRCPFCSAQVLEASSMPWKCKSHQMLQRKLQGSNLHTRLDSIGGDLGVKGRSLAISVIQVPCWRICV